jgi:hypothetical protein
VVLNSSNIKQKLSQKPANETILMNSNGYMNTKIHGHQNYYKFLTKWPIDA